MTRDEALLLLHENVKNENLRRHMYATEAAMRAYAAKMGGDPEEWGVVGLLHDFDYEIHPTEQEHPVKGQAILEARGVSPEIRQAIMAHAPHTGTIPKTPMEKASFAVDELTGFIVACALVTPQKQLADISIDTIKKKLKQKSFAAKVNRNEINRGVELLETTPEAHFQTVLESMQAIHGTLGL